MNDPEEWNNLAENPKYARTLREMLDAFQTWQRKIGDPFANPDHVSFWLDEQQNQPRGKLQSQQKIPMGIPRTIR